MPHSKPQACVAEVSRCDHARRKTPLKLTGEECRAHAKAARRVLEDLDDVQEVYHNAAL